MSDIRISQGRPVIQINSQIESQVGSKSSNTPQGNLRSLDTGDRLQGKILSMSEDASGRTATISLGQDEVISARLSDGMSLREGQTVSFEVRGTGGQITLTPLFENMTASQTMLKALTAAGLEANQDNLNMIKTMMENGASIDKDSLTSMHSLVSSHPDTSVNTLVQMKSLNIPINENTITQFESYKNYEHKVVETMDYIMDELPGAYNELSESGNVRAANDLYGKILNMLSEGAEGMSAGANPEVSAVTVGGGNIAEGVEANIKAAQTDGVIPDFAFEEEHVEPSKIQSNSVMASLEEVDSGIHEEVIENTAKGEQNVNGLQNPQSLENAVKNENANFSNNQMLSALTDKELLEVLKGLNKEAGPLGNELQKLIAANTLPELEQIDAAKILKELSEAYQKNAENAYKNDEAFSRLFQNDGYNKLIKGAMKDEWLIKPEDVGNKENVENLYQRLNTQARQLTESLTNALGAENRVAQSAASLQNNIDFMNQINQMFHYIQLPLKMQDQDAHGDLYVYSNGKKKFEPGETVSAILHLDMDNLGPLDVYVKMKENNVKTNFYVADESVLDLIEEHIDMLNERLEKRGYSMQVRTMLHTDIDSDSEDMPVDEMFSVKKVTMLSVTSFDARA